VPGADETGEAGIVAFLFFELESTGLSTSELDMLDADVLLLDIPFVNVTKFIGVSEIAAFFLIMLGDPASAASKRFIKLVESDVELQELDIDWGLLPRELFRSVFRMEAPFIVM